MRSRVLIAVLATLAGLMTIPSGANARGSFDHLHPGGVTPLREQVPVNFVFVGYEPDQVARAKFLAKLPERYRPQVRSKMFYGLPSDMGIGYTYDFQVTFADAAFEDQFFGALSGLADPAPLTLFQQAYNDQKSNVLDVTREPLHRRAQRGAVADRPRARRCRHHAGHPVLHQLVGPGRFQVPRVHEDERARSRHRLQLRRAA